MTKPTIRWDDNCRETVMRARQSLVDDGMKHPTIRSTLYKLMSLPGWTKEHYDTLCVKLGEWRDDGLIEFGLFSDAGGGDYTTPWTPQKIAEQLALLRRMVPAKLGKDGYLHGILVEHESLIQDVTEWCDYGAGVVSSQGQLRRENLFSALTEWRKVCEELGGKGVKMIALVDYDKGGRDIFGAHQRWLKRLFSIDLEMWGITEKQVREAGLSTIDKHQIDGWVAAYGPRKVRTELRNALHVVE